MENIVIRPIRDADAKNYLNLTDVVWRDAYKHIFPEEVFVKKEERSKEMVKTFSDFVYHRDDQMCYVAEVEGKLVGLVSAKVGTNYDHFKDVVDAELMALYILPEYQGKGIGSTFKNLFVDWARQKGAKKFLIGVLKDNHKARKVYERWGGVLNEYSQPFVRLGIAYDEVFYTYDLNKM